jgi:alkylation response protein AidB-like acyl-CoA dehydrogenase
MTVTDEDSDLFRAAVADALKRLCSSDDVRRAMATARGFETPAWSRLGSDLGLAGLTLPEKLGGGGLSTAELAIAFEEAGARLLCAPLLSTAGLAVPLLAALGDAGAVERYGTAIAGAELTATVALAEDAGRWTTDGVRCTASRVDESWALDGDKNYVVDGATAGLILVVARTGQELGVFAVQGDAPGLEREQLVTLDQTRKQARLRFTATPAARIGGADATLAIGRATAVSRALLAAEQVGGAQACLDMTVGYAKSRIQFGRAIGSFQAVKQRLAEMLVLVESARSAAVAAAAAAAGEDDES